MDIIDTLANFDGQIVPVPLGPRSYPIYIAAGSLGGLGRAIKYHRKDGKAVIITDRNVGELYGQIALKSAEQEDIPAEIITIPPGEKSKRSAVAEDIYNKLFDYGIERQDTIIALGGGVVGDLAGFAAATFKRGVNYVQVPTSLLAMVDSSVGGKTGINHNRGKNMIGAFYQPKFVFADIETLKTLPARELGCGWAETVKHAVIKDGEFFEQLEQNAESAMKLKPDRLVELVARNCRIKAAVVAADERESSLRGILNFGHTIGHTIETVMADRDFHHGEAVALGMIAAAKLAVKRGLLTTDQAGRITNLLAAFGLATTIEKPIPTDDMYQAMRHDKKNKAGRIRFVLPRGLGRCEFVDDLTEAEIKEAIKSLGEIF